VLTGRATLYGVLAAGDEGVQRALAILADEFQRTMQLCGTRNCQEITSSLIVSQDGPVFRPDGHET